MKEGRYISGSCMCRAHSRHLVSGNSQALDNLSKTWKLLAFYCYNLAKCKRRCSLFWLLGCSGNILNFSFQNLVSDPCEICAVVSQVTRAFFLLFVICKLSSVLSKSTVECLLFPQFCELCGYGKLFQVRNVGSCGFKTQKVKTFKIDSFEVPGLPQ